jgi:hypothetical protein
MSTTTPPPESSAQKVPEEQSAEGAANDLVKWVARHLEPATLGGQRAGEGNGDALTRVQEAVLASLHRRPQRTPLSGEPDYGELAEALRTRSAGVPAEFPRAGRFIPLQEWEGRVLEIDQDLHAFRVELIDRTGAQANHVAEFWTDDVPGADRELLQRGAIVYWSVGYQDDEFGSRSRSSQLRIQRLPRVGEDTGRAAERRAAELDDVFDTSKLDFTAEP